MKYISPGGWFSLEYPMGWHEFEDTEESFLFYLKSATKPLNVLIAFTRPLITEFADNLNLKHPLLPTISPYPTM